MYLVILFLLLKWMIWKKYLYMKKKGKKRKEEGEVEIYCLYTVKMVSIVIIYYILQSMSLSILSKL